MEYVRSALGVRPQLGGEHPRMGTHNALLRLGDALYLEVIAPNPRAPAPGRPRWFGLDTLGDDARPALSTWVARSEHIRAAVAQCPEALGQIEPMSRGDYQWLITVPGDGRVPLDGVAPALIEWRSAVHPAARLEECGCSLVELRLCHPDTARVRRLLATLGLDESVAVSAPVDEASPYVAALIDTPLGRRELSPFVPALVLTPTQ